MARQRTISEVDRNLNSRFLHREQGGVVIEPMLDANSKPLHRDGRVVGRIMVRSERRRIARAVRKHHDRLRIDPIANLAFLHQKAEEAKTAIDLARAAALRMGQALGRLKFRPFEGLVAAGGPNTRAALNALTLPGEA